MAQVGFVGLGVMGGRMVRRLLAAGHPVTGWNRTRAKAGWLLAEGMGWADSPRAVVEASEVTFSMVTGTAALRAVTEGDDGVLAGLGAPVSGSVVTLEEGRLSIMVGGDREVLERVLPVLRDIGPTVTHVGPNGRGALMKIATNLSLAVQMTAFSEGVLLAEKGGIPREAAVEVLLRSAVASPMVRYRGPFVLKMPDEAWFDVDMMQKDLLLALEAGRELDVPLPTTAVANELLTTARAMGLREQDFATVFTVLARMSGRQE